MRIYLPAELEGVEALAAGTPLRGQACIPSGDTEDDEYAAFIDAAARGTVVIAADVDAAGDPVALDQVASFHLDLDGTGDLAWFATQESAAVLLALRRAKSDE